MEKVKVGIIFGGMSTEHEISCVSGQFILDNLDKDKYEGYVFFISKDGKWYKDIEKKILIENIFSELKKMDVIFPVLHGLYGEDGTVQGIFELLKKPYVGCNVLASSVGMDKAYTKVIFEKAKLNQAKYQYIKKYRDKYIFVDEEFNETIMDINMVTEKIEKRINYPMFVKPSNSGSSVGINKAHNTKELIQYINEASKFDKKILVEQGIFGREIECAVLGNEDIIVSGIGEIKPAEEFYSYNSKYNDSRSVVIIPADLSKDKVIEIQKSALKAFKAIDGKGLSRIDFFVEDTTNKVYINEINTMPGFTSISMYPKLFEYAGIKPINLIDRLIDLAFEDFSL